MQRIMLRDRSPSTTGRFQGALLALLLLAGCGGGGSAPFTEPLPDPLVSSTAFKVDLRGGEETTAMDATARGAAVLDVRSDGRVDFVAVAGASWVGEITGMHVHRGMAGADGPVVVDLLAEGASFDPITFAAQDQLAIDAELAAEILSDPAAFYVNIHTTPAPAGLVRGQLDLFAAVELHGILDGEESVPVADGSARGGASLRVTPDGQGTYVIAMGAPTVADVQQSHIHRGSLGENGGVVLDLDLATATQDAGRGILSGTLAVDRVTLTRLCAEPSLFYWNVHTLAAPQGVARGQVRMGPEELLAPLAGDEETSVVDPAARAGATILFDTFTSGRVHLAVQPSLGIGSIQGAHVHDGPVGVDGPVAIDLTAGADYAGAGDSAEGAIAYDQETLTRLLADPGAFYVNIHTASAPAGLARGQLTREPTSLFATLRGDEETSVVDPGASGTAALVFPGIHACSFSITLTRPSALDVVGAHVHQGAAGTDGPVLIDLLSAPDLTRSATTLAGSTTFTGRTLARLLANAGGFYVNTHTAAAPAGIARGQLDPSAPLAPAGLAYTTPVTYQTGQAVTPNVPSSSGGAVVTWSISPALPAGLGLDPLTGVISGTPTAAAAAANYTVTAVNAVGSANATVNVTVTVGAPTNLVYSSPVTYVVGSAIVVNAPSSQGGAIASYGISPSLPAGLSLSLTTGVISGTPTTATAQANYTVTGSNAGGSTTATVTITVQASLTAPSGLSYTTPATYTTGSAITANTPTIGGGAVSTWSISPTLSAGLSFSTSTGAISGTPTAIKTATTYTVTAANAAGSTTASVVITVNLGAPTSLTYSNSPGIGYVTGGTFASMSPSSSGGTVASYAVSPTLPSGISISTTTGVISGSPSATSSSTNYTVTATNAAGSTTATVTISVLP